MNARNTLFAMLALGSLATSAFAQDWTSEATVSYARPAMPVTYTQAAYVRPAYVRPVVYTQPTFVARPVIADYYPPVYRPVVAGYTPTCVAGPATCAVPTAQPVVPANPKVWVHEKVYVQGQPLRNLVTAITP